MDDSSDDELFSYANKQKLTFSSNIDFKNLDCKNSSSSSEDDDCNDNGDDCDSDVEELITKKTKLENNEICTPQGKSNPLLQRIAQLNDIVSPSPSPSSVVPTTGKQKKRPATRRHKKTEPVNISLLKKRFDDEEDDDDYDYKLFSTNNDILTQSPADSLSIVLKIRLHGAIEKYEIKKADSMAVLIQKIASKENVLARKISLSWRNSVLETTVSPKTLGLTIADILECYIHEDIADKENSINVKIQSKDHSTEYAVHINDKVQLVIEQFCQTHGGKFTNSKFSFDGESIEVGATYSSLDMMDGDIIDAVLN